MSKLFHIPRGKDFWSWPPVVILMLIAALLLSVSASRILVRERAVRAERIAAEREIARLEAEKNKLQTTLNALNSPESIERMAKERLNLKKPGEEVVVVTQAASTGRATLSAPGFWGRFVPDFLLSLFSFLRR